MKLYQLRKKANEKGFTLIELMIVIAIIGILAAIAIPNFISYRNKSFCSRAETDANNIAGAVADYFAIPTHTQIATADLNMTMLTSGDNTATVSAAAPNTVITITVTDASGRCPSEYQAALDSTASPTGYWSQWIYTKLIQI